MPPTNTSNTVRRDSIAIPIAIVIAAGLIAGAIYLGGSKAPAGDANPASIIGAGETPPTVRQVDGTDHIRGNPNAQIVLVEYSDFECPFCKSFHETLQRIMDEYGASGNVAWVYRHYPIEQLHPNAPKIAEASECVAELGGNTAFWKFADLVFGEKETNTMTDMTRLPEFAETSGVLKADFNACLSSGRHAATVAGSADEAMAAGGAGTPHTLVLVGGESGIVKGAQPYAVVKQIIDNLVSQLGQE